MNGAEGRIAGLDARRLLRLCRVLEALYSGGAGTVNQADLLFDGAQVHVPLPQPSRAGEASSSETGGPSAGLSGAPGSASGGGLDDVNTASLELLTTFPGIGSKTFETLAPLVKVRD